jgi:cytochrome c5
VFPNCEESCVFNAKPSLLVKSLVVSLTLVGVLLAATSNAAVKDQITARLQAPGKVCVFGEDCAKGMKVPGAAPSAPKTPETVYNTYCQACHAKGVNNAPTFGDAKAWAPHIAKGKDVLYQSAINGFNNNAMPPRGTCVDCSDDDIHGAVDYMVSAAKK